MRINYAIIHADIAVHCLVDMALKQMSLLKERRISKLTQKELVSGRIIEAAVE